MRAKINSYSSQVVQGKSIIQIEKDYKTKTRPTPAKRIQQKQPLIYVHLAQTGSEAFSQ